MTDDTLIRNLATSSLYAENVLTLGHAAVWGSFFDRETQRWGYACCQGTARGEACPQREAGDDEADCSSDEQDAEAKAARIAWRAGKLLDDPPPQTLEARGAYATDEDFLAQFILYWFHTWTGPGGQDKPDQKAAQQTREALLPLLQQLRQKAVEKNLLGSLAEFADLASKQEYAQANDVYVGITIGKATWHTHLDLGEQRAHWGQGCSLRTMQRQVVEKDHKNASLFDTDPVVQRYVHALKRMVTYMQSVKPSADPSKQGHVPAPKPAANEVGLPVVRNIRDSDGRGHEPEFVDPNDTSFRDAQSGIAFGRESSRNHPFTGIGHARGI
eukprot:TRINITY_DN109774_c0_g1_i1.p1 TRINITY_DN109774_c0_g1~~TRINITY_DN109774_c0_g1_i1.p1  ORF type:complete len:329 (-),score=65.01 TRINITY_DN109774_c0_g1_i1:55-1041(-)